MINLQSYFGVVRKDDPMVDLINHARACVRGDAHVTTDTRVAMLEALGLPRETSYPGGDCQLVNDFMKEKSR
jgi:hypothetical protein